MTSLKIKMIFDFCLALMGLFFFLPLIILISFFILIDDGFPILYYKKSLGKDGKIFTVFKFRSLDKASARFTTRIGNLLRGTALDELPQLINIVKGEMSFVGPRSYSIEKYGLRGNFSAKTIKPQDFNKENQAFFKRLEVMPGLTGLAQISAPKYASNEEVLRWDLKYIKERAFLGDLFIILLSVWISFLGNWEKTSKKFRFLL